MALPPLKNLDELYQHALGFYGLPYIWGGDFSPGQGGDCSGLVQAILSRANLDPKGDQTAHDLYLHFRGSAAPPYIGYRGLGALAFFGSKDHVSHVGWMTDKYCMISAAGGGSHCTTSHLARQLQAFVKLQPLSFYRAPPLVETIYPDYKFAEARPTSG